MFKLAELFVDITANPSKMDAGLAAAKTKLGAALAAMKGMAAAASSSMLPLLGIAIGAEAFRKGITGASDLAETMSKVEVVFGEASGQVTSFGDHMATTFGSNKKELLDAAAGFGLIAKGAGFSKEAAAGMSVEMARLADDASSFYNVPLEEALGKIKSALVGESEPIRSFGVLLNESAMKSEALKLGLKAVGGELTESQKVMARASLIQKGLSDATGDHARTSGGFANQLRELQGRLMELAVALGSVVLPVLNMMLRGLNAVAYGFQMVASGIETAFNAVKKFSGLGGSSGGAVAAGPEASSLRTAAPGGMAKGLDHAKEAIIKEKESAAQKLITDRVRTESEAADKIAAIHRNDQERYKREWITTEAATIAARNKTNLDGYSKDIQEAYKAQVAKESMTFAKRNWDSKTISREGQEMSVPKADQERNAKQKVAVSNFGAMLKEKALGALAAAQEIKGKGIGVLAQGANALDAAGEQSRRDKEKKQNFQSQSFEGGRDYSKAIQAGALGGKDKVEEKEIAKNTKMTVDKLIEMIDSFKATAKKSVTGSYG